jgi:mannose-6-phosphate isomerase-like protein (cupin superfamily)
METINGCTVIPSSASPEPAAFGPAEMDGAYRVLVVTVPAGQPAPPFPMHPNTDEAFYVAEGQAGFLLGDREVQVTGGGFVFVPRGMPHTAWNSGDSPLRGLILISPGDAEHVVSPSARGRSAGTPARP